LFVPNVPNKDEFIRVLLFLLRWEDAAQFPGRKTRQSELKKTVGGFLSLGWILFLEEENNK
jgi:hypothetical protein